MPDGPRENADWRELRAVVHSDPALQRQLAGIVAPEVFARRLGAEAAQRGIVLSAEAAAALVSPDVLGLARFTSRPPDGSAWPCAAWLPAERRKADEPNDDWLKCIEATSDELLRPY